MPSVGVSLSLAQSHLSGLHAEPRAGCWRCGRQQAGHLEIENEGAEAESVGHAVESIAPDPDLSSGVPG